MKKQLIETIKSEV